MSTVSLDFETYCDLNLKDVGAYKYAQHPSFKILCVAWDTDGVTRVTYNPEFNEMMGRDSSPDWYTMISCVKNAKIIEAHNAEFEYAVVNYNLLECCAMPLRKWRDSAATAAYKSLPRGLEKLAQVLGTEVQKDMEGSATMKKMSKDISYHTKENMLRIMEYCKIDVLTEIECSKIIGHLPPDEQKVWERSLAINMRGITLDMDLVRKAIEQTQKIKAKIGAKMRSMIGINPSQTAKLLEHLKSIGYEGDDLRRESVKLSLALPTSTAEMRELLQMRLDYSTTSLAKFDAMVNYAVGNNVQGQFMYHGASTGRWSGKGIQFQNLPRGEFDKKIGDTQMEIAIEAIKNGDVDEWFPHMREMAVMKSAIRGAVIPLMGTELLVMDYSQIEARVLAWLAGQQDVLDAFRSGYDYYKFTASQIYGVPYESVDDKQRFIGKTATLALGYQGGSNAFQKMAINFGVFIDTDKAESIKSMWRIKNNRIQLFWHNLQTAAISAVEGFPKKVSGKIVFRMEGDFLTMRLPSGRKLWYYKPKVEISKKFGNKVLTYVGMHEGHWERRHTYGGHLAENATQAVSRDFVAMSIIKLHEANMPVVLHVHDEIVCEAHKHQAEEKLEEMRNIMLELPYWAEGLPLNAEGFRTTRYRKG